MSGYRFIIRNSGWKLFISLTISIIGIILIWFCIIAFVEEGVTIELPQGKIKGRIITDENDGKFYGFYQIYYAAAPTGPLRFKPPQKRKPWIDTLDATNNTVYCYQRPLHDMNFGPLKSSEDCLYVNVITPIKPGQSEELLPVYVYIHGGGFVIGSAGKFDGMSFAKEGVVVVTVNYRLGVFGFLSTEDDVISGNMGLKDQKLAFEWVHDNIIYFNGDASQYCFIVPFNRAVHRFGIFITIYGARKHAFELGRILNPKFISNDSIELLKVLQTASADDIFKANLSGHFAPILEKSGDFSYKMLESYMNGNVKNIQLLIGFTSEEKIRTVKNDTFLTELDSDPSLLLDSKMLNIKNKTLVGSMIKRVYTNKTFLDDFPAFIRYYSEDSFETPSLKQAELLSKFINVFVYKFSYKGDLGGAKYVQKLKGCDTVSHNEDTHYMWRPLDYIRKHSAADQLTSKRMVRLWSNFIKTGNPTPTSEHLLENIFWPIVGDNNVSRIPYLNLNESLEIRYSGKSYKRVKAIYDGNMQPPYIIYTNNDGPFMDKGIGRWNFT